MKHYWIIGLGMLTLLAIGCADNPKRDAAGQAVKRESGISSEGTATMDEKTYSQVPEMPRFPGCERDTLTIPEKTLCANQRLTNYVYNRLRYPKEALEAKVQGTVIAQFVVRPDGLIDDIQIHNDIGYGCGETLIKIVESMNHMNERWIPGKKDGMAVRVRLALPVEFRLKS